MTHKCNVTCRFYRQGRANMVLPQNAIYFRMPYARKGRGLSQPLNLETSACKAGIFLHTGLEINNAHS